MLGYDVRMPRPALNAVLLALFAGLAGFAPTAHAYLDPSTGSMILSAIVGLFATVGLAVKTYWYKLKGLFRRRSSTSLPSAKSPDREDRSNQSS